MSHALHFLILMVAGWLQRRLQAQIEYLIAENAVYKQRLGRTGVRFINAQRRQLAIKAKAVGRKDPRAGRNHRVARHDPALDRRLVAVKYDSSFKRGPGRPRICIDISALIVRMAKENPGWGYTRIRGALGVLGMHVSRSTIQRALAEHGVEPAPERGDIRAGAHSFERIGARSRPPVSSALKCLPGLGSFATSCCSSLISRAGASRSLASFTSRTTRG